MSDSDKGTSSELRFMGRVKWFNNKSGYGFITATSGDMDGTDVFVHHSSIVVSNQQYRYLVQGEYVEFSLSEIVDGKHKYQTASVTGINKGMLMCETHHTIRMSRHAGAKEGEEQDESTPRTPKRRTNKVRGSGPRDDVAFAQEKSDEGTQQEEIAVI